MATATFDPPPVRLRPVGDSDHDLIAAVRAGDDAAFATLYERYHRRIAAYIFGMVKDYGRAEDIAQDVFMSALRRMRATDRPIAFKPWLYEIAKNACIDQFRRSRRGEEVSYDAEGGLAPADHGRLVAVGSSPDAVVEKKQSLDHLCGAFGGLSETHHQILVMRELEGLSYREIGERLGMSRPSVESTLFRARRRLAEEYGELVSGQRCLRVQGIIAGAVGGTLGARDRRRMAAHVSHCQPCRKHARHAGIDLRDLETKPVRAKIAALLPLPAFLRRRWGGAEAASATPAHSMTVAQWGAQLSAVGDPAVASWAKAVAAAATLAIAGVGAGAVGHHGVVALGSQHGATHARDVAAPVAHVAGPGHAAAPAVRRLATSGLSSANAPRSTAGSTKPAGAAAPAAAVHAPATSATPTTGSGVATPINSNGVGKIINGSGAPDPTTSAPDPSQPDVGGAVAGAQSTVTSIVTGGGDRTDGTPAQAVTDAATTTVEQTKSALDGIVNGG